MMFLLNIALVIPIVSHMKPQSKGDELIVMLLLLSLFFRLKKCDKKNVKPNEIIDIDC